MWRKQICEQWFWFFFLLEVVLLGNEVVDVIFEIIPRQNGEKACAEKGKDSIYHVSVIEVEKHKGEEVEVDVEEGGEKVKNILVYD